MRLNYLQKFKLGRWLMTLFLFLTSCLFPNQIAAQIVINEFSVSSDPEWVELYNSGLTEIDLNDWKLVDEKDNTRSLSGTISANGFFVFETSGGWLNNSGGDIINLKNSIGETVDTLSYGHSGDIVNTPASDKSCGRVPDNSSNWRSGLIWTKGLSNFQATPIPTSLPSPSPTLIPLKAVYKINKSKDDSGNELSNVKIYVDDKYIHHEDAEVLEFYLDHECYAEVVCDLGNHNISLQKEGYSSWEDNRDFNADFVEEVYPVLKKQQDSSPTPTPTTSPTSIPAKTSIPTVKPTQTPQPTNMESENIATATGSILGANLELPPQPVQKDKINKYPIVAVIIICVGLVFVILAFYLAYKTSKIAPGSK